MGGIATVQGECRRSASYHLGRRRTCLQSLLGPTSKDLAGWERSSSGDGESRGASLMVCLRAMRALLPPGQENASRFFWSRPRARQRAFHKQERSSMSDNDTPLSDSDAPALRLPDVEELTDEEAARISGGPQPIMDTIGGLI